MPAGYRSGWYAGCIPVRRSGTGKVFVARENVQPPGIGFVRVAAVPSKDFRSVVCPVDITVAGDAAQPSIDRKVFAKTGRCQHVYSYSY